MEIRVQLWRIHESASESQLQLYRHFEMSKASVIISGKLLKTSSESLMSSPSASASVMTL